MPLDITKIRGLCFDVDGTLRDTDDQYVKRFARMLSLISPLLPGNDAATAARRLVMAIETPANFLYSIPDRLGVDDHWAAFTDFLHRQRSGQKTEDFMIIAGVQDALAQLSDSYPMAVVTARGRRKTVAFLEHYGLSKYFEIIASAQTTPRTKPKPDPILWTARQMGLLPSECVMIGDTTVDIHAGVAAGAQTIGVLCGFGEEAELRQAGADLILPSTANVIDIFM